MYFRFDGYFVCFAFVRMIVPVQQNLAEAIGLLKAEKEKEIVFV